MVEIDLEDFIEEVKFQMTEHEELDEATIKDWESKARAWVDTHKDKKGRIIKGKEDIIIKVKDEDVMYEIAEKFYQSYRKDNIKDYWYKFTLLP